MKKVILFGSTGSIGTNTIKVIKNLEGYKIAGLATFSNHRLLVKQAKLLKVHNVGIIDKRYYNSMKENLTNTKIFCGEEGLLEMIERVDGDILVAAFSSAIGIYALLKAIKKRMRICLATKEILVSFGEIVMQEVKKYNTQLIPIDSEHSAIFQCLEGRIISDVEKIILTASGGPFLNRPLKDVKREDVLKHPVWNMGKKITVDSATMMNKALEIIEAHHLFQIPVEKISVVIHPEAICHSLVQFVDGSILGQFSRPDMKLPIQYALTTPERRRSLVKSIRLERIRQLTFLMPNYRKFPGINFAYQALKIGKSMPAVLNGANESAVHEFLQGNLRFQDIPLVIKKTMDVHRPVAGNIDDYRRAEIWARQFVRAMVKYEYKELT
ncbi:MAG: 1-deoxy-D-xylulose-5-phosphate reductoisomerase [bacterium]